MFPTIRNLSPFLSTVDQTSHVVTLPTYAAGDLLILEVSAYDFTTTDASKTALTLSGWSTLASQPGGTNLHAFYIYYKIATGSEGSSVTITSAGAVYVAAVCVSVTAGTWRDTPEFSYVGAIDPASLTPSWGEDDVLWIAAVTGRRGGAIFTAGPTGYTFATNDSGADIAIAYKQLKAASEDPSSFSFSISPTTRHCYTIAIRGALPANNSLFFGSNF